jgi:hypothetical protein
MNIDAEIHTGGRGLVMTIIPSARMVVITVIIMCFITAGQGKGQQAEYTYYGQHIVFDLFHSSHFSYYV